MVHEFAGEKELGGPEPRACPFLPRAVPELLGWGRGVQREPLGKREAVVCFHRLSTPCAPLSGDLPLVRAAEVPGAATSLSDKSTSVTCAAAAQTQTQPQPPGGRALRRAWQQLRPPFLYEPLCVDFITCCKAVFSIFNKFVAFEQIFISKRQDKRRVFRLNF